MRVDVVLTRAELDQLRALPDRYAREGTGAFGWWMLLAQAGLGLLVALLAVAAHAARAERAGIVAVGGYLACWAAMSIYRRGWERVARRDADRQWALIDHRYSVKLRPAGMGLVSAGYAAEFGWARIAGAEAGGGFIQLRTRAGNLVVVPEAALPDAWPADQLLPRLRQCIRDAAPG